MPTPQLILLGLVLPAVLAGIVALVGSWFSKGHPWPAIVGLALGVFVGYRGIVGHLANLPAVESPERIVWFGVGLGIVMIFAALAAVPSALRWIAMILAPAAMVWFVFLPLPVATMPNEMKWRWVGIAGVVAAILILLIEILAIKRRGVAVALTLGPVAAGVGVVLLLLGTTSLGWMAAAIGLMILGWCGAGLLNPSVAFSRAPVVVAVALLAGILTYDYFDSDSIGAMEVGLLCVAPLMAWVVELPWIAKQKPWKREILRLVLVSVPVIVAVVLAIVQFKKESPNGLEM